MREALRNVWKQSSLYDAVAALALAGVIVYFVACLFAPKAHATEFRYGPYAGIVVGYDAKQISSEGIDLNGNGAQVNGLLGVNLNAGGGVVVGLEGDFGYAGVKGSFSQSGNSISSSGDWNGSVRGRAGLLFGSALLYGTAGVAFSNDTAKGSTIAGSSSDSDIDIGFVGGGGVDLQLTNTVALRVEALEYIYPSSTFDLSNLGPASISHQDTIVRAGLVFDLN